MDLDNTLPAWALEAADLPVAFAQVREDPLIDAWVVKKLVPKARIIMIADTIDAMTTDRPYRRAMSLSRAIEELEAFAGRQFDPQLVKLVSKSASIRRLVGGDRSAPEPSAETPRVPRPAWAHRIAH